MHLNHSNRIDVVWPIAAALFVLLAITYTLTNAQYNSDFVENVLWAEATYESGTLVGNNFYWAYILPLGGNVFLLPFVATLGPCMLAKRLGMLLFLAVFLASIVYLAFGLFKDTRKRCIFVCVVMAALGTACGRDILNHIIYYGPDFCIVAGTCGCMVRILRDLESEWSQSQKRALILAAVFCFWGGANGIASIALSVVPVGFASIVLAISFRKQSKKVIICMIVGICATAFGLALYYLCVRGVGVNNYSDNVGSFSLASRSGMLGNIAALPEAWLFLFRATTTTFQGIATANIFIRVIEVIIAMIVAVTPIAYIVWWRKLNAQEKLIFFTTIALIVICVGECVLSKRGEINNHGDFFRLLFCASLACFILLGNLMSRLLNRSSSRLKYAGLEVALVALIIPFAYWCGEDTKEPVNYSEMASAIEQTGLKKGYATYWNANVTTVLTGGKTEVAVVAESPTTASGITRSFNNTMKRFYDPPADDSDFYVLLTQTEYEKLTASGSTLIGVCKEDRAIDGSFRLLIYNAEQWDEVLL